MDTHIRSELNHIKADEALINKTEVYLRDELSRGHDHKSSKFSKSRLAFIRNIARIACIVLIVIQSGIGRFAYYKEPVSYISLDINPSIELGVNIFDRVVTAKGYNDDGKNVLTGLNVTGTNVSAAISSVISSAVKDGFIESDGSTVISVTSETNDIKMANMLEYEAESGVNKALEEKGRTAIIVKDSIRLALRNEAKELSIAPGKLNLIKKLQAVDPVATVDQYRGAKVKEIVETTKEYADSNTINNNEVALNSQEKGALDNKQENTAMSKDQNAVKSKGESIIVGSEDSNALNTKAESVVSNKNVSTAKGKGEGAVSSKDKNVAKGKDESPVNNTNGQVNSNQNAAVSNKHGDNSGNNTKNTSDKESKTVKEWLEKNSTRNSNKSSKK